MQFLLRVFDVRITEAVRQVRRCNAGDGMWSGRLGGTPC